MSIKMFGYFSRGGAGTIRVFWQPIGWALSHEYGTWWIGLGRWRLMLKAPWNAPLFSERHGYRRPILRFRGWRLLAFSIRRP